jgi:predicted anti-sigma-YlaC factor YlaD
MEEGKMSHPQFEAMLFDHEDLNGSDRLALEQHLHECDGCRRLASRWAMIETRLYKAPMVAPKPGFGHRFQARLLQRRRRRREWIMISLVFVAFVLLLVVAVLFGSGILALVSPGIRYLLKSLTSLLLFGGVMQIFTDFARLLIERLVAAVSASTWLTYSALFSGLAATWFAILYKLNFRTSLWEVGQ